MVNSISSGSSSSGVRSRQDADTQQLDAAERKRLQLKIGDSYIDPKGKRIQIETADQLKTALSYIKNGNGIFVFKGPTGDGKDIVSTAYYQDKNGIDILRDGGNYTNSRDDDYTSIEYGRTYRNALKHDMRQDGNAAQQNEINKSLKRLDSFKPNKNAISINKAEEYLYHLAKKGTKIDANFLLTTQNRLLKKQLEANKKGTTLTDEDQDMLNAVSRLLISERLLTRIDSDKNGILSAEELTAEYRHHNGGRDII